MKVVIAISVAFLLILGSNTADAAKCKYIAPNTEMIVLGKKEQQRLLNSPTRWTRWKSFRSFGNQLENHGWLNGMVDGDKRFLGLKVVLVEKVKVKPKPYELQGRASIPAGASLLVLMADESIIELKADAAVQGNSKVTYSGPPDNPDTSTPYVDTQLIVRYELDADTLAALKAQPATDIRVATGEGDVDFSFGKKPTDRIQEALGCI